MAENIQTNNILEELAKNKGNPEVLWPRTVIFYCITLRFEKWKQKKIIQPTKDVNQRK